MRLSSQVALLWGKPAALCRRCGVPAVMRRGSFLLRSLWFLVLLGAATVLLLFHLQEVSLPIQHQSPGVDAHRAFGSPVEQKQRPGVLGAGENADLAAAAVNLSYASSPLTFQASSVNINQPVTKHGKRLQSSSPATSSRPASTKAERLKRLARTQESRRRLLSSICARFQPGVTAGSLRQWHLSRLFVEDRYKVLYCEVPKAGCSNWKRVLMVLSGIAFSTRDIPHDTVHYANSLRQLESYNRTGVAERLRFYTKVLFVREPFERLVSAFRDKFESPNAYYHSVFGRPIISKYRPNATHTALSTGAGVTFREFVHYLLDVQRPVKMDIHWEPVSQLCSPCAFTYNFIGRFESLQEEAGFLLQSIGAPRNLTFPDFKDRNPDAERTSPSITQRYFAQLNAAERQRVFDFYYMDYLMFNYSKPFDDLH